MIEGGLFTRDFLLEGIRDTQAWAALDDGGLAAFAEEVRDRLARLAARKAPNEAQTEDDVVYPVLEALGWRDRDVQPNASAKLRLDVPDALLYRDEEAKAVAGTLEQWRRFAYGLCIVEAKRWQRPLDREDRGKKGETGTPSSQMLRYLRRVEERSEGALQWGILTNGRIWRLYFQGAMSVAEDFLEIDLGKVLAIDGTADLLDKRPSVFATDEDWRRHALGVFVALFRRAAFLPDEQGETFHALALREGKRWEAKVARTLSDTVFGSVFPRLADALARGDPQRPPVLRPAYLDEVREAALVLLYRLLFVLYAEDRDLLPDEQGAYASYCLTRVRRDVAERLGAGKSYPSGVSTLWPRLRTIFRAIARGNDDLGVPPYNGGLFDSAAAPLLERVDLDDATIAAIVFGLSHQADDGKGEGAGRGARYINYRDLSVQQLGAVYERILEYGLRVGAGGRIEIDADDEARHESGSYYTPEALVALIIQRAVGPLVAEHRSAFEAAARALAGDRRPVADRIAELEVLDPASAILRLKVCDPAMGSGHFLVSLVDWLADEVLDAMADAPALVSWAEYESPLVGRIERIRGAILEKAAARGWVVAQSQLDDRHVVRRMALKRCVFGVDKNPMAVELAKVSLWLHSFTVGAPLSFLDHHLRAGDSVLGAWVRPTLDELAARGALFNRGEIARIESVAGTMAAIEDKPDSDIAEVEASKSAFGLVEEATEPLAALFSLVTAERLLGVFGAAPKKLPDLRKIADPRKRARAEEAVRAFERAAALQLVLEGTFGDPVRIASGTDRIAPEALRQLALPEAPPVDQDSLFPAIGVDDRRRIIADDLVQAMRARAATHRFFHWEVAFPNVWTDLASSAPRGGFDAVIGNPPYVRQEKHGDEVKRALRSAYRTYDGMADLFVYFYEQGLRLLRPGGRMSYVVTNKWLRAGYAEALRGLFAEEAWLELVADFGHVKHLFPDADVFPSVVVVRKPVPGEAPPADAGVCVIPREDVPRKGLDAAVAERTFPLPRASFTRDAWVLEPKPVMDLLAKIRRNGVPLAEYAGTKPYRGVLTGFNEAFLIDTPTRDRLVAEDPGCAEIIKPYLRGQDIERWWSPWKGLWMIFARRGIDIDCYPSVKRHLAQFRTQLEPKPAGWEPRSDKDKWPGRKEGAYAWYELQDTVDYYERYDDEKIIYQVIQFYPSYSWDESGVYGNDKSFFLPCSTRHVLGVLNSPLMWWHNWRQLPHLKDEALSPMGYLMENLPIGRFKDEDEADCSVAALISSRQISSATSTTLSDWLRHEFDLTQPGQALAEPHRLDADAFVAAVRKALPRKRKLSPADVGRLKQAWGDVVAPARTAAAEAQALERKLSDLVNEAYGLTPEEVALMWRTAPPRMPIPPPPGLDEGGAEGS